MDGMVEMIETVAGIVDQVEQRLVEAQTGADADDMKAVVEALARARKKLNSVGRVAKMEPNPEIVQQAMWNRNKQVFGALEKALGLLIPEGQVECTELEGAIQRLKKLEINSEYGKMIQGIAFLGVARNREWQSQRSRERGRSIPRAEAQKERNHGIEGYPQER